MLRKNILAAIALSMMSFISAYAQQKKQELANEDVSLVFFNADSAIQPTNTSLIVYTRVEYSENANKLIGVLNKKGVPAIKTMNMVGLRESFDKLRTNAIANKITTPQIGILILGDVILPSSAIDSAAFIATMNTRSLPNLKIEPTVPLFIDQSGKTSEGNISFYLRRMKRSGKTDIHLHQPPVADSVQSSELISWMSTLGLLKPVSNEKTKAQKKQQDWANFMKMIDDRLHNDWAWLKRYEADNQKMPAPSKSEKRVVFLGNSITEGWINQDPGFFRDHGYINRGIGGQSTPQMLVRFREDVVNLHPQVVIILAGINDIAQNTGPSRLENVAGNIISMAEIAKANGIKVILCSVLPAFSFPWHPGIDPVPAIAQLNKMLQDYAENNKLGFVNYYPAVVDDRRAFKKDLAIDGVHPNLAGYKVMEPLAEAAIEKALLGR